MKNIVLFSLCAAFILPYTGCATETVVTYPVQRVQETPRGVYVGAASVDGEVLTDHGLVFLNSEGSLFLKGLINHWYQGKAEGETVSDEPAETLLRKISAEQTQVDTDSINLVFMSRGAEPHITERTIDGKPVRVFTADRRESAIAAIAADLAERKTVVVYLVLTAGSRDMTEAFISDLSEKTVSGASSPLTALSLDMSKTPKKTTRIDGKTTGMNWLITLLVLGVIGISTAVVL
ncbi:MAG: hypothetical protein LBH75_04715 [Treponema sp.]|jgi:hypothetical protein|nr:hypothetical protein [Treponema sp.]